jgi:hypothetical protein
LGASISAGCQTLRPTVCVELPPGDRDGSWPRRHRANRKYHALLLKRDETQVEMKALFPSTFDN